VNGLIRRAGIRRNEPIPELAQIYVDGSCDNRGSRAGGWAIVVCLPERHPIVRAGGIPARTTSQIAELTAAIKALEYAREHGLPQTRIVSDSKYVVRGAKYWVSLWKRSDWKTRSGEDVKNQALWRRLSELDGPDILWVHIRGHRGNVYNEMADKAAVNARWDEQRRGMSDGEAAGEDGRQRETEQHAVV